MSSLEIIDGTWLQVATTDHDMLLVLPPQIAYVSGGEWVGEDLTLHMCDGKEIRVLEATREN